MFEKGRDQQKPGSWINGYSDFKNLTSLKDKKGLRAHLDSYNHKASHLKAEDFLKNHQEQGNPAADLLGTKNKEQIARNRKQAILGTKISGEKLCPFPRASREVRPWESKQMPPCSFLERLIWCQRSIPKSKSFAMISMRVKPLEVKTDPQCFLQWSRTSMLICLAKKSSRN